MTMIASRQLAPRSDTPATITGVSVVVPVYNEELAIDQTLDDCKEAFSGVNYRVELVVVDDGSTDASSEILERRSDIRLLQHRANLGYGASLKTGIRHARYPLIVVIDADGTYPVSSILELIAQSSEADMVVGARIGPEARQSRLRLFAKWFLTRFAEWIVQRPIPDLNSGMRVFHKRVVMQFLNILPDGFSFTTTITLAMMTSNHIVQYTPINYHPRLGRSKIKPVRDTLRFLSLILRTGALFAPLRVFLPLATIFFMGFTYTLMEDVFVRGNLTERTILLAVAATQLGAFSLLADMIHRRSS